MPPPRPLIHAVLPLALATLVVTLAVLQYRWLGQVSEAERRQMRESLARRAEEFANAFDRDLGTLYSAFSRVTADGHEAVAASIGTQMDSWRANAEFPELLDHVYVVPRSEPHDRVLRYAPAERRLIDEPWPDVLRPIAVHLGGLVRDENATRGQAVIRIVALGGPPVVSEIPALLIWLRPVADVADSTSLAHDVTSLPLPTDAFAGRLPDERALVLQINRTYVIDTVIPALAARLFGSAGETRLQVLDAAGRSLYAHGLAAGAAIAPGQADVSQPFFAPRLESPLPESRQLTWLSQPAEGNTDRRVNVRVERNELAVGRDVRVGMPGDSWSLRIQHAAGSLDQAVALARRRNLHLSFGILGVLVGAMVLVIVNARRAERLAARQMEFVTAVSHELRTPLAVIRSAADNIATGVVQDPAGTRRYGELIGREGRRLTDLVEQVLTHAGVHGQRRPPHLVPVDVGATLHAVVEAARSLAAEAGCSIDLNVEPGMPRVLLDDAALRGAVENLVSNALKHAASGAWVGLAARTSTSDGPVVEIVVSDRGPGIPREDCAHIFEPFYRGRLALERQVKGTGLGLSLVKRSVEEMGGTVAAEAAPGGGTRFVIRLPLSQVPGDPGPSAPVNPA